MKEDTLVKVAKLGLAAYRSDKPITDNPYSEVTDKKLWEYWRAAWVYAQVEAKYNA